MQLRTWQQEIIDRFPSIVGQYRRFILKAPTGAGKTVLASELVERFYDGKKIIVLCHRLVLLEQLEKALAQKHNVRKLAVSDTGPAFADYDILLSTNMRAKEVLLDAIPKADQSMADALELALPIFERHWWPAHDARNRAWIESVAERTSLKIAR